LKVEIVPVEVLTKEDITKLVEEELKKVLSEIAELRSAIETLKESVKQIASASAPTAQPLTGDAALLEELKNSLGSLAELLDIQIDSKSISLKPKRYLGSSDFRAIGDVARKRGGYWASRSRAFIIPRTEAAQKTS
jgi:hypothetical protein